MHCHVQTPLGGYTSELTSTVSLESGIDSKVGLSELQNIVTILKFLTNTPKSQWLTMTNIYFSSLLGQLRVGSSWLRVCPHSPWAVSYLEDVLLMASAKGRAKSHYHIELTKVKLKGFPSSFCLPLIEHNIGN